MDNINNNYDPEINTKPAELAQDFLVETSPAAIEEFPAIPTEYVNMPDAEFGEEYSPEDEQVATYDGFSDFDGLYNGASNPNDTDYDAETSEDIAYDEELSEELGYNATESFDPSDEQAATTDELHSTPTKACATERCKLDDYEIISDVLGSEKQIVKLYSTALCEASEEYFRNVIRENLDEAASDQYKAFEFMQKRGMYPTEQAQENDIIKAKQQFAPLCDVKSDRCGDDSCNIYGNCECGSDCECSADNCECADDCYCEPDCDCD